MNPRIKHAFERDDTKTEKLLNQLLDIITILKWQIRIGIIVVGFLVVSGLAFRFLRSLLGGALLLGLFFLPELLALIVGNVHHKIVFPRWTDESDDTARSSLEGVGTKFCVFLRPFEFDGCYFIKIPTVSPFRLLNGLTFDLEGDLYSKTNVLKMSLTALGGPPRQDFRTGRSGRTSSSDADWKDKVVRALERCKAIFIIPAPNPGTLWELELIASRPDFLNKTLFIMPPRPPSQPLLALKRRREYASFVEKFEMRWGEAQTYMEQHGIILPNYSEKGSLFVLPSLYASPKPLATLFPLTNEGTDAILEYLIDKAGPELLDELLNDHRK